MRLRKSLAVASVAVLALFATACGKDGDDSSESVSYDIADGVQITGSPTYDKAKSRGHLIVGVKDNQPNLGFLDPTTNKYSGFDIEVARMTAASLGFDPDKIEYKAIQTPNRETAIQNGEIDYYVGTYSITDSRKQKISFAGPYYIAGQDLLVRKKDDSIVGPESLNGKTVCTVTGSTSLEKIQKQYPQAKAQFFDSYAICVDSLKNGQVDAVTTDDAILKGFAAQDPDNLKVVGKPFSTEKYGIGLPKDDAAFRGAVNDAIAANAENGNWKKAYDATLAKSGLPAPSTPPLERY